MIKQKILRLVGQKNLSISALARELGISQSKASTLVEFMVEEKILKTEQLGSAKILGIGAVK